MSEERDRASEDQNEATQRMSAGDHTAASDPWADDDEGGAETRVMPPGATRTEPLDATRAMPAVDEADQQVWAARAAVPAPAFEPVADPAPAQWQEEYAEERTDRSWLRPVLIALVVLTLLGILATGLWLIVNRSGGRSTPAPAVSATASGSPAASGTPSATRTPTAPTNTAATQVAVPDVVGLSEAAARQQLAANGLSVTVSRRTASGADPGTVIATDPGAGVTVARGSQVTLVVAAAPAPAPTTPAPTRSASPAPRASGSPSPART